MMIKMIARRILGITNGCDDNYRQNKMYKKMLDDAR